MALAWNAGWVNSPRGFKSRILRHTKQLVQGVDEHGFWSPPVWRELTSLRRRMGRKWFVLWHALSVIAAGVLYFYCVLPRWYELMGDMPRALGMAGRIASGRGDTRAAGSGEGDGAGDEAGYGVLHGVPPLAGAAGEVLAGRRCSMLNVEAGSVVDDQNVGKSTTTEREGDRGRVW